MTTGSLISGIAGVALAAGALGCWMAEHRRRRAAQARVVQLEKYQRIFELAPEPIALLDAVDGRILELNDRAVALAGFPRPALLGHSVLEWPHLSKESKELVLKNMRLRMQGQTLPPYELEFVTSDGRRLVGFVLAVPLTDRNGKLIGDLVLIANITSRKEAEERLRKMLSDMERHNRLMVGRELRVVELKKEINALLRELGRPAAYPAVEARPVARTQESGS
jgi:PAS domain S-box-containing protein